MHIHLKRRLAAIDDLTRAVKCDSDLFLAWYNLGHCYFREGRLEGGYYAFSRAAAVSPGDRETILSLLMVCGRLRKDDEFRELSKWLDNNAPAAENESAHAELERALQLAPIDHRALMRRAQALFDQGSYRASVRVFGQLLRQIPTYCEARIGRAASLSRLLRFDEALTDLDRVRELDPEFPDIWLYINSTRADRDRCRC